MQIRQSFPQRIKPRTGTEISLKCPAVHCQSFIISLSHKNVSQLPLICPSIVLAEGRSSRAANKHRTGFVQTLRRRQDKQSQIIEKPLSEAAAEAYFRGSTMEMHYFKRKFDKGKTL